MQGGDRLTSKMCSLGKLKREMTIVVSITFVTFVIFIIISFLHLVSSCHIHNSYHHQIHILFTVIIFSHLSSSSSYLSHVDHHNVDRVVQVVDHERDSAYFGTTSGDVIKVDDDDDD